MTRPTWLDEPHVRDAIAKAVAEAPATLTADQLDLLRRTGFFNTRSTSAPAAVTLPPPATDRVAAASGAAGHNVATGSGGCGEVAPLPAARAVGTAGRSNSL